MKQRVFGGVIGALLIGLFAVACTPSTTTATSTPIPTVTVTVTPTATPTTSATSMSIASTMASALAAISPPVTAAPRDCLAYKDHVYEACFAYVWNDAHWSLQPYYKYVHSDSVFSGLVNRVALKYKGHALQVVRQRAANWPAGTNTVDGPDITIQGAWASLSCNRAILVTRETWTVRSPNGTMLYQENDKIHTVVLERTPDERFEYNGTVLHQWVVSDIFDGEQAVSVCE